MLVSVPAEIENQTKYLKVHIHASDGKLSLNCFICIKVHTVATVYAVPDTLMGVFSGYLL